MNSEGADNGQKLRRGRISLERKKEILEQYDLLSKPCADADAAALFGVTQATLTKILAERNDIEEAVTTKKENASTAVEDSEGQRSTPKFKRGRISYEKQKELLDLYDKLPNCSYGEAASKLGIKEGTLLNLLARRRAINSGKRKRKRVDDSSSDSDNQASNRGLNASYVRRGPVSAVRQKELLEQYDQLQKPVTNETAAAELGISKSALAKLLSSREASAARFSPLPGSSGLNMTLRKGRRVRVDYSEDEQSGSDYRENDSDFIDEDAESNNAEEREWKGSETRKKKIYTPAERERLLAKYDEMQPTRQLRAAQILGITQSTLSNWLQQRASAPASSKVKCKKIGYEGEEGEESGEEIDSYVLGSTKGTQVVQFFEVNQEERDKKSVSSNDSNTITRKPHLTLREKFEMYKKYDSMHIDDQRNAASIFNLNKSTWLNLITNRCYYIQRFKTTLKKDMGILDKYDELENKRKTAAAKALNVPLAKIKQLLENREIIEKYYNEILGSSEDAESMAPSVEEAEASWKDSEELRALELDLLHWFKQAKSQQVHINWRVLKEKAKELAAESGMEGFWPSDEWLKKWNKSHRVFWNQKGKLKAVFGFGENRSMSECILTALKDYPPENVFNLVETGLYYRAVPGFSPVTSDWVIAAFVCNMSGNEKKKLLVVGRSEAPLRFRVMSLPLVYKYSKSGRMSEELVCDFLQDWDQELAETNRHVAVILDSSTSHPNVHLNRIHLFFVPMECSEAQPLNDGVVSHAKALYRKRMSESCLSPAHAEKIAVVDALFALAEAWENVPKSLLVTKFLQSTFPQNETRETSKDFLDDEELERLNQLDNEIQLHSSPDRLHTSGSRESPFEGGQVVHMEGTVKLSDEEEDDFDIDSLLRDQVTCVYASDAKKPDVASKLKSFLQKPGPPNGSFGDQNGSGSPTVGEVRGALATIKKFLQHNGCTLEDLTDYTQLEIKVLSKIKNLSDSKIS